MTQNEYTALIDNRLATLMHFTGAYATLANAMTYSVGAGGKRIRPTLCLMANEMLGGDRAECLDFACAIEMIHTYSLIHDDLPAMDNDDLRRGKPTNHVVFGDAMAILAGDGLLTYAFQVMTANALRYTDHAPAHVRAMEAMADAAGVAGMVSGQAADIELEGKPLGEEQLAYIHTHKTADMIEGALVSGAILANATTEQLDAVRAYGEGIGFTFQIVDDLLDLRGSAETLGKTPGKDAAQHKTTYPTLLGVDKSEQLAEQSTQQAIDALSSFGPKAQPLEALARRILKRDR